MTKTKFLMPLLVLLILGMASSAFAQTSCNVASTPVSRDTSTGHTEQAGDLIFNCSAVGAAGTTAATITISYGVVITNDATYPAGRPIAITSVTPGSFTGGAPTLSNATISNATGQIVINIPAQPAGSPAGSFSLTGVLVSLNGTGLTTLDATVSASPGNGVLITAGQNVATVITTILPGINTTTAPPAILAGTQAALYPSTSATAVVTPVPGRGSFTIVITENYIDMLKEAAQFAGALNDTNLAITFSGLATGSSITGCTASVNLAGTGAVSPTATAAVSGGGTVTVAAPTLTITFAGTLDLSQIEQVRLTCTGYTITLATTPQPLTTAITATVTLAPTGAALSGAGAVLTGATTGQIPRYQSTPIAIGTVLAFTPNTTTFIIPFAIGDPSTTAPAGAFDTGIAIANTTGETIGGTGIFPTGGAQAQAGTITFHFFPSSGTAADRFSVTTASVASGASYVANVSEILRGAGRTASFIGYIIGVANFTNGHGMAFLYGGTAAGRITSATDVLVISSPVNSARSAFAAPIGVEQTEN